MDVKLYAGTIGWGVWASDDLGDSWDFQYAEGGMYAESRVWALSSHPAEPGALWAGTDSGLYRLDEAAGRWTHVPSPADGACTWALGKSAGRVRVGIRRTIHGSALYPGRHEMMAGY